MAPPLNSLLLPEAQPHQPPAFTSPEGADAWLARQPQAQPVDMLTRLHDQVEAIDAAGMVPSLAVSLLDRLHKASLAPQDALESRYLRKPLPLSADDWRCFELAHRLWQAFGIAYLRVAPHFAPAERCRPLHRAANALRLAKTCHFQAAHSFPAQLDRLLFAVLAQAHRHDLLRQSLIDPDFPQYGNANIAGHLAWAFLLQRIDPYRLSAAQLAVANRALGRWRELAVFQGDAGDEADQSAIDLGTFCAGGLPDELPRWLGVRRIQRKISQRLEALAAGESPESLKLGRELSGAACIRLLNDIAERLRGVPVSHETDLPDGDLDLIFGAESLWSTLRGEPLDSGSLTAESATLAHQRLAMFGFDRVTALATAVQNVQVPTEHWHLANDIALRASDGGPRRQTPCLVGIALGDVVRIGVMGGLHTDAAGRLAARLRWFAGPLAGGRLPPPASSRQTTPLPVFLLGNGADLTLVAPPNAGLQPGIATDIGSLPVKRLLIGEVRERGVDFVRYSVTPQ